MLRKVTDTLVHVLKWTMKREKRKERKKTKDVNTLERWLSPIIQPKTLPKPTMEGRESRLTAVASLQVGDQRTDDRG